MQWSISFCLGPSAQYSKVCANCNRNRAVSVISQIIIILAAIAFGYWVGLSNQAGVKTQEKVGMQSREEMKKPKQMSIIIDIMICVCLMMYVPS